MTSAWAIPRATVRLAMRASMAACLAFASTHNRLCGVWLYCHARAEGQGHDWGTALMHESELREEKATRRAEVIPLATARNWHGDKGEA